jgi:benzoate transport
MTQAVRDFIEDQPMSAFQWRIVAIMIGLNAIDGFDVLAISFASPGIARDWSLDPAALGFVLSMELIGMAFGSMLLGNLADRFGRRKTIIGCLVAMTAGMALAGQAHNVTMLCICRVVTGVGIGGMLAATNAAVSEAANARRRDLCVLLMAGGFPLGAVIGGTISATLLADHGWQAIFQLGALVTLIFIPIVYFLAPESIAFELRRGGPQALASVNTTLRRMGHLAIATLPDTPPADAQLPFSRLFSPALARTTLLLTAAYLAHIMTYYFIFKWIPKIVADMGHAPAEAAGVLVWANVGGVCGALVVGLLTAKIPLRLLTIAVMTLSVGLVILFGRGAADIGTLTLVASATGFAATAGVVGLYGLLASSFPTAVRATATGFTIGVGRGGAVLAPMVAGGLFAADFGVPVVALIMALGSALGALALVSLGDGAKRAAMEPA